MFMSLDLPENKEQLTQIITDIGQNIATKLEKGEQIDEHQQLCLVLIKQYGSGDIGILFTFFLNIIKCSKGESFVCSPDEPHAYIQGELMEAMVNSDNVVRGGLTPKYKDTKTLVEMLKYKFQDIKPTTGIRDTADDEAVQYTRYPTGYPDFMISHLHVQQAEEQEFQHKFNSLTIAFVLSGTAKVEIEGFTPLALSELKAYMILPEHALKITNTSANLQIYFCTCDI